MAKSSKQKPLLETVKLTDDVTTCPWRMWGPYLSDRQWGTVREDYSPDGSAWDSFTHDDARRRAFRWGEDGIAGFCDRHCQLCLSVAVWNGKDSILKERLFGLTNSQGNHGEDVKELYFHEDAVPSHAYQRMSYLYPHAAYPYEDLIEENARRGPDQREYEIVDTGVFNDNKFFDVMIEYAKAGTEDILMRIEVHNRGSDAAAIDILPHAWFRNKWSWSTEAQRPRLKLIAPGLVELEHPSFPDWHWMVEEADEILFCENETNPGGMSNQPAECWYKDAFHERVVEGKKDAVNPENIGSKAAGWIHREVQGGGSEVIRVRLGRFDPKVGFKDFEAIVDARRAENDAFHTQHTEGIKNSERKKIHRLAISGMLWTKQFYDYDVSEWLDGDPTQPAPPDSRLKGRNHRWRHFNSSDILLMPDSWEYPWFAAWDLAFHCVTMVEIDPAMAKTELRLFTREWYMHPNGQLPAYEWAFQDVNPPVHAWAAWRVFTIDRRKRGDEGDLDFLESVFHKLMLNFTWWVNRKDDDDRNVFEGGFLGLDNIGVFDRSSPLPTGGHLDQADGTSWMAMYSLNLLRIALELAQHRPAYQDIATKFFEHFLRIVYATNNVGEDSVGLWDPQDEFYYDMLRLPDGTSTPMRVRSMVGLIPLFAVEIIRDSTLIALPEFVDRAKWIYKKCPHLSDLISRWHEPGQDNCRLLAMLREHRLKCILKRMLDPEEFLSPYGIRAVSRYHLEHPYQFNFGNTSLEVKYTPGESDGSLFGGNSNWRGPIWFPVNFLIIESLQKFQHFYGDDFKVECPTGSGNMRTLGQVADELRRRLISLFTLDKNNRRPFHGDKDIFQMNPLFRDKIQFHEYFHGDTGRGCGASHQTGWTALAAKLCLPRKDGT
ncbi:MAG: glucosidase [Planctomycetota bacterium]|nr:glucosidase [Planctomycetota bacterium]